MGTAQKKPHGRGDAAPHGEANSSHGHWRGRGGSADKYKLAGQEATDKAQTNGAQGGRRGTAEQISSKAAGPAASPVGGEGGSNLDAPAGALPPPLARLKNEGNLLFKNGQFADALEKYSLAITGFTDSGRLPGSGGSAAAAAVVVVVVFARLVFSPAVMRRALRRFALFNTRSKSFFPFLFV